MHACRLTVALAVLLSAALAAATPAFARVHIPHIDAVAFSGGPGNYTATITGRNFGAAPDGIPCTACTPVQLEVVDLASQPHQQTINVTSWTDTAITATAIAADKHDGLRVAVYNQLAGNVAAWGGHIGPEEDGAPHIASIVASGSGSSLTVTITGTGFGQAPSGIIGEDADSPYLVMSDWNAEAPLTDGFPWNAGFCGANDCNGVTIGYQSWTDTQIVVSGFGDEYGQGNWEVTPRDAFCIGVWPSTSTSNGTTGGAVKCRRAPDSPATRLRGVSPP